MAALKRPSNKTLNLSMDSCLDNGWRLIQATETLEFLSPPSTRFYLAMIAQEEFAKGFLLFLIREDIVPFTPPVLRAMNDHSCKQLLGMILDYVIMHWDDIEEIKAMISRDAELGEAFPNDIGSALEILRHEKIGRWEDNRWSWAEDPDYDRAALAVAEGKKDRQKQDALYVRIGRDGRAVSTPLTITEEATDVEEHRAARYGRLLQSARDGENQNHRYDKTIAALRMLFGNKP